LSAAPSLRQPEEWALLKSLSLDRASLARSMLVFSESPSLHAPLSTIAKADDGVSQATRDWQAIEAFAMLQRFLSSGDYEHVVKLLELAGRAPYLRNELYFQLLKQLSYSPMGWYRDRGWKLLGLYLRRLLPDGFDMECVVEAFLLRYDAKLFIDDLHALVFGDQPPRFKEEDIAIMKQIREPDVQAWEKAASRQATLDRSRSCWIPTF